MKITDSSVQMAATHTAVERHEKRESLTLWRNGGEPETVSSSGGRVGLGALVASVSFRSERVSLSSQSLSLQPSKAVLAEQDPVEEPIGDLRIALLKAIVERLTGRKIEVMHPHELEAPAEEVVPAGEGHQPQSDESVGWGLIYDYYESHYEAEATSFSAQALVHTEDGRQIEVSVDLNMSREFFSEQSISIRAGDALKDPLVVNFAGTAAQLTDRSFSFDLDADGRLDQIAFVKAGSGFLALDKNGDETINDGSELFGPRSGDGFSELAEYDKDGNNWIDENDAIYDNLRIWSKDAEGNDQLMALGMRNVGAIYLGHVDTPFLLKDPANQTLGAVRDSGIYLEEEGGVGTIQQLDLVV
jgi:hypothetical protein